MSGGIVLTSASTRSRDEIRDLGDGVKGGVYPYSSLGGSQQIMVGSTVYFALCGFRAGDVITNLIIAIGLGGATLTNSQGAVYATDGQTRHAVSVDRGTEWQSTGRKLIPMSTPYTVPADQALYLAIQAVGTTLPTLRRGASAAADNLAIGSGPIPYGGIPGQATMPATFTPAGTNNIFFWVGWS